MRRHMDTRGMTIRLPEIACVLVYGVGRDAASALAGRLFSADEILDMHEHSAQALTQEVAARAAAGLMTCIVEAGAPPRAHRLRVALASTARDNYVRRFGILMPDAVSREPRIEARLKADGYREVFVVAEGELETVRLERQRLPTDQRHEPGPFDIIGDVHGCGDELEELLSRLGYRVTFEGAKPARSCTVTAPAGRRVVFVGDLVDRGPRSADVLRIVVAMVRSGAALLVPGNHDVKFLRWLEGQKVAITHGLDATLRDLEGESPEFLESVRQLLKGLWSHVWLDGGRLAVAHAGITEPMIGRATPRLRHFCIYGDTNGDRDASGLPLRYHWALDYRGATSVVYGHTPVADAEWVNNTLCIDTGCCFGGKLTALRWPERDIVSVPARAIYAPPLRPFGHPPERPPSSL